MKKKIILSIGIFLGLVFVVTGVAWAKADTILNNVTYTDWSNEEHYEEDDIEFELDATEDMVVADNEDLVDAIDPLDSIPNVTNILLIGEENVYEDTRGRTDSMMILSINKATRSIKLTSLMRDSLVEINGYQDNRLNAAYAFGGMPLLKETIENNFGITIDNTMLVNFDGFENIIDALGGVDIEITSEESEYLNTTNYISKEEYRTTVSGINHFNGNQVLGYCRVRYVPTLDGEANDFGRTNRQRKILNAIFEKYATIDKKTMIDLATVVSSYITTDMNKSDIVNYAMAVSSMDLSQIDMLRLPVDGGYSGVSVRGMSVLSLDWDLTRNTLKDFIYDDENFSINQ